MRRFANHMLIITVEMVKVIHAGMKMFGKSVDVWPTPVPPLENNAGAHVRRANPTMMTVISTSRREEDFVAPAPLDMS